MKLRPWLVRLHRWIGLASGLVVGVVALTGAILTFQPELDRLIYSDLWSVAPGPSRISSSEALQAVREEVPERRVISLRFWADPVRPYVAGCEGGVQVFVDPYRGGVLGQRFESRTLLSRTASLHRTLLGVRAGRSIVVAATIVLAGMVLLGLVLWWPGRRHLAGRGLLLHLRRGSKRANLDLHSVVGFYASLYLLLICLTGAVMGLPVLRSVAERLFFADRPAVEEANSRLEVRASAVPGAADLVVPGEGGLDADRILALADREAPGAVRTNLSFPRQVGAPARVIKLMPDAPWPDATDILYFDSNSSELLRIQRHADLPITTRLNRLVFPIHAGTVYGWPTRILAALVSLVAASLPLTGAVIWYPRWRARRSRRGTARESAG